MSDPADANDDELPNRSQPSDGQPRPPDATDAAGTEEPPPEEENEALPPPVAAAPGGAAAEARSRPKES
jgi:hypothetical protein